MQQRRRLVCLSSFLTESKSYGGDDRVSATWNGLSEGAAWAMQHSMNRS
jgi:hypothetical protein